MKNLNDVLSGVDEVLNSAKHGNFEDVLTKTKSYAEIATKKSAERLEISRKKIELLDSKTKLAKAFEKYGRLQYSAYLGEELDEEAIESALQEIQPVIVSPGQNRRLIDAVERPDQLHAGEICAVQLRHHAL